MPSEKRIDVDQYEGLSYFDSFDLRLDHIFYESRHPEDQELKAIELRNGVVFTDHLDSPIDYVDLAVKHPVSHIVGTMLNGIIGARAAGKMVESGLMLRGVDEDKIARMKSSGLTRKQALDLVGRLYNRLKKEYPEADAVYFKQVADYMASLADSEKRE